MSSAGFSFQVEARCAHTRARAGRFETPHGAVATPAFMPVGTRGTVKGVLPSQLAELGATMLLANTYHLHLRPGAAVVRALGGLHRFMNWTGPLLTDSGGYQVFSLGSQAKIDERGVEFRSVVDGSRVWLDPEGATDVQIELGADVIMAFDQCPASATQRSVVLAATERTHRWLERCVARFRERGAAERGQALFGIVQGGAFEDLRRCSVDAVCGHDLVGYAIGGASLGEGREQVRAAVEYAALRLPEDRPRYLMGVGTPRDFFDAVERGVDLFDCVTPTRHGRTHQAFTSAGVLNLRNQGWALDPRPLDPECDVPWLAGFSRGYLRHLCNTNEMLGAELLTLQNLGFFARLMQQIRAAIRAGTLPELRARVLARADRRVTPADDPWTPGSALPAWPPPAELPQRRL